MSDFFDNLGSFFKDIFKEGESTDSPGRRKFYDNDMQDAWDELEDYLNEGKGNYKKHESESRYSSTGTNQSSQQQQKHYQQPGSNLKQDYANLKVPFGSSMKVVKEGYKKLLRQYHPDRHAKDPEKLKLATEITAKINNSYSNIEEYEKKRGNT